MGLSVAAAGLALAMPIQHQPWGGPLCQHLDQTESLTGEVPHVDGAALEHKHFVTDAEDELPLIRRLVNFKTEPPGRGRI